MCGILFSTGGDTAVEPSSDLLDCLNRRGPDQIKQFSAKHPNGSLSFVSSVLSLRGESLVEQPLQDPLSGSVLSWNGEAWKIDGNAVDGNDAEAMLVVLLKAVESDGSSPGENNLPVDEAVVKALYRIQGPYAFIFYSPRHGKVFYGRDKLGRRSLLRSGVQGGSLMISSVCSGRSSGTWTEVEANGIYVIDLSNEPDNLVEKRIPWPESEDKHVQVSSFLNSIYFYTLVTYTQSNQLPSDSPVPRLELGTPAVDDLLKNLRRSLTVRITNIPCPPALFSAPAKLLYSSPEVLTVLCSPALPTTCCQKDKTLICSM